MAEVRYVPAAGSEGWRAAVSAGAIAVLSPAVTPQTAEAVWRRLDGGGIGALVEALTGAFGTSLTAIPPFALVVVEDDGVRVAVRGPLEVVVEGEGGATEVSGRGVATWAERLVARSHRVAIAPGAANGEIDEAQALPIASGVVPVDGLVLTTGAARAASVVVPAAPAASPSPRETDTVAPAPEPESAADAAEAPAAESAAAASAGEPATEAPAETAVPSAETTTSAGEPSGSDTWIPSLTQVPLDEVPAPADDSTIATPRHGGRGPSGPGAQEWAATVVRGAVPAPDAPPSEPRGGDHDGATISVAEARRLRGETTGEKPGAPSGFEPVAFEPVGDVPPRRPARGRVRLSSGQVVELERPVVIGRRPRSTRASGAELPTLIAVESPEGDISRSHIEIRAEGEHVLVTDLATTNGTVLLRGGQDPVRLHPSEPTMVVTGDVLDLGDGVTVTFEDLP